MLINIEQNESNFVLSGELNRQTVPSIGKKHITPMFTFKQFSLDFAQVTHCDTAGLAWVLLVIEKAKAQQCEINFINLPQDMVKLAQLSAVDTLFSA